MAKGSAYYKLIPEHKVTILVIRGVVDYPAVKNICTSIWNEKGYDRSYNFFCDVRECEFNFGLVGITKMTTLFIGSGKTSKGHVVVVSDSPEGVASNIVLRRKVRSVFRLSTVSTMESGLDILGLNPDEYNSVFGKEGHSIDLE